MNFHIFAGQHFKMLTSSQSFGDLSTADCLLPPTVGRHLPSSTPLQRTLSKSESAIETPTTTSDEQHSSPCSSRAQSTPPAQSLNERIEYWQRDDEQKKVECKLRRKLTIRFATNAFAEEEDEEKGRGDGTKQSPLPHQFLCHRKTKEKKDENEEGLGERAIILIFRKYKIGYPESTV